MTVVVTRHEGLVAYLRREGLIPPDARVIAHASPEDVRGQHVIGVLPLHLAALAASVTEVPLALRPEDRGRDLDADEVAARAGRPVTYKVTVVG
jgi:putative CRISPR-associated protein (TIGR02620 family)